MDDLEAEWSRPRFEVSSDGRMSWMLRDTSPACAPWAWIVHEHDGQFHLEVWRGAGRGSWVHHAAFATLSDAQSVGRIMARIAMQGGTI